MVSFEFNNISINGIKLAIFDKDGTLMELYHYWSQMIDLRSRLICERLGLDTNHRSNLNFIMGVDEANKCLRSEGPVGVKQREIVMQAAIDYLASVGYKETYDLCLSVFTDVDRISSSTLKRFIKPIPGASELIHNLSSHGCKIAIATTDKTKRATLAMSFLGFGDKIELIMGADMVSKTKPDPEMIFTILNHVNIDKSDAVMVGDAVTDIQIGLNAGLKASIGVLSGLSTEAELLKYTSYIISSVSEIRVSND